MRWLSGVNIFLGLIGLTWLLVRTSHRWGEYPTEIRALLILTSALFFGLLETSVEMYVTGPMLFRSAVLISVVKVFALYVLWVTRATKYRTGTRHPGNGDSVNPNKDIE